MKIKKIPIKLESLVILSVLAFIIFISIYIRFSTYNPKMVLDYDPWWYYRYTKTIMENNLRPPTWDSQSFATPGRAVQPYHGWSYTMIIFYYIANIFSATSLMIIGNIAPLIIIGLTIIIAYLLGKELSNKWGGISTAIFSTLTPTLISVSMAGYCDTDATVVFFSFLCVYSFFLAIKKKKLPFTIFAILINLAFIFTWPGAWYVSLLFSAFIPALILFRFVEQIISQKSIKINISNLFKEKKFIESVKIVAIILVALNVLGTILGFGNMINFFSTGLGFIGAKQIVNVSVAELQPINIFSKAGFTQVASRVGTVPLALTLIILPILVIFKIFRKVEIKSEEIFLFLWAFATFYLILNGVRFSLLFSCAVAVSAGYVIGNIMKFFSDREIVLKSTFIGFVILVLIMFISDAMLYSKYAAGMAVNDNWIGMLDWLNDNADKNSLVATWWDPGHIIAGYTGLKVHADGAHCSSAGCFPYPHNTRIQNMGRIMSTSDEQEAIDILEKYIQLTPEQCQQLKQKFGDIVPEEACEPISEMYFIASSDLIGKFTWMNYFGGYRAPIKTTNAFLVNPGVCCAPTPKTEAGYMSCGEYANDGKGVFIWCPWIFTLSDIQQDNEGNNIYLYNYGNFQIAIIQKEDKLIPVYNNNYIINHITFFLNNQKQDGDLTSYDVSSLEKLDGLVWIDPSFKSLIYFAPEIKDSIFVRTFFYGGEGLDHFELVYQNSEIKLYKVNF